MKKPFAITAITFISLCFIAIPVLASVNGPVYELPIYNACDINGNGYYMVRGRFSTNGIIIHSQTELFPVTPSVNGYNYIHGGYQYIYRTSTGHSYVPYDDGYTETTVTYYNGSCDTIHHY